MKTTVRLLIYNVAGKHVGTERYSADTLEEAVVLAVMAGQNKWFHVVEDMGEPLVLYWANGSGRLTDEKTIRDICKQRYGSRE